MIGGIVLAAGSGERLGGPKQFLELEPGQRLVDAAVAAVSVVASTTVVVLPAGISWDGAPVDSVVPGGATRRDSVAAGLGALPAEVELVVVHDAAHPLAPMELFEHLVEEARAGADAAVPFLGAVDVVKRSDRHGRLTTVGRAGLGLAQVPMAFRRAALEAAHQQIGDAYEDSELVERIGGRVVAVAGSSRNIHVVTAEDLAVARCLARCP